jgi:hypothetical protein
MPTIQERLREEKIKARINLAHMSGTGLGLIILQPSGAFYTHETGGSAVYPALAEGVFVPLHQETDDDQEALLTAHFTGPKWGGWCSNGIDEETASDVDHVLSLSPQTSFLKVDRARLVDSREAWIYVDVSEPTDNPVVAPISGFGECKGIFVWEIPINLNRTVSTARGNSLTLR